MPLNEFTGQERLKNTDANDCGQRTPSNENLKKHVEKVHKKEKLQITFVVPSVIQKSKSGTNCMLCASMQALIWSEVFVWISARLRFHKKTFRVDFQSEISKVEVNFSVKSVRVLKCSHNFRIKQHYGGIA